MLLMILRCLLDFYRREIIKSSRLIFYLIAVVQHTKHTVLHLLNRLFYTVNFFPQFLHLVILCHQHNAPLRYFHRHAAPGVKSRLSHPDVLKVQARALWVADRRFSSVDGVNAPCVTHVIINTLILICIVIPLNYHFQFFIPALLMTHNNGDGRVNELLSIQSINMLLKSKIICR